MKSLMMALLIAVTSTLPVYAQNKTTREATYALLGPVKTVRTETADVNEKDGQLVEGARVLQMTISFTEDGRRPELCLYDENGSLQRRIVIIFEGRKEVEFLNYDGAGKMWLRGVSHYDAEERVREKATYNGDGSLRSKTILTRNARGQVIEIAEYSARGTLLEKFINTYNDAGALQLSERSNYDGDGLLRFTEVHNMAEKRSETVTYKRDGSLAGKSVRVDQGITEYAPDGSLKKSTLITNPGRLPAEVTYQPDGTTRKESQIPDEIDAHGNWIKQTRWVSDSKGTRALKVTYREITYYKTYKF